MFGPRLSWSFLIQLRRSHRHFALRRFLSCSDERRLHVCEMVEMEVMSSLTIVLIVRALFGSCPSAKNGRGDKDMAENNVGSAEQYEDSGRWRWIVLLFNQTINVSILLLVCFVLSCFYYMLSICICIGVLHAFDLYLYWRMCLSAWMHSCHAYNTWKS